VTFSRRPLIRLLVSIPLAGLLVVAGLSAAWLALGQPQVAQGSTWFQVTRTGTSEFAPAPDKPFFFLALGNDGRSDADPGLGDAIHVIGVNPAARSATILDLPRDTQSPSGDKINAYHALQGLQGMVNQLNKMMGIDIQYAVTVNFPRFTSMVDQIGGIDVNVPQPMHDEDSGANFEPGIVHMNGDQALSFSRDRHSFIDGDLTRSANQGLLIISALATLRARNPGDTGTIKLAAILARHVQTENVSLLDMFRLGRLGLSIDPANIKNVKVPVGSAAGTQLVLSGAAPGVFRDFADDGIVQSPP